MAGPLRIKFTGQKEVSSAIRKIAKEYPMKVRGALRRIGEHIMTDSKADYVPIDKGNLKNSGHVESVPGKLAVALIYGGPVGYSENGVDSGAHTEEANYAVAVHEIQKNYKGGRQWKYLETPLNNAVSTFKEDLAKECQL